MSNQANMKKTSKIISKRVKIKAKSKKVMRKKSYQSHYNANDTGGSRRAKRSPKFFSRNLAKKIINLTS